MLMKKNKAINSIKNKTKVLKDFLANSSWVLWFMLILLVCFFTTINFKQKNKILVSYNFGDVSSKDIKAPRDFFIEDKKATALKKSQAKSIVKNVYDFDASLLKEINSNIDQAMQIPRDLISKANTNENKNPLTLEMIFNTKPLFEKKIKIAISKGAYAILYKHKFSYAITDKIKKIVGEILTNGIVANKQLLLKESDKGIILRTIGSEKEKIVNNLKLLYSVDQAKTMVRVIGQPILKPVDYNLSNLIVDVCQKILLPNITLNKNETEKRIQEAQSAVKPVLYIIKKGEMILREGEIIDEIHMQKLSILDQQVEQNDILFSTLGLILIAFFCVLSIYLHFLKDHPNLRTEHNKHMLFLFLGLILYLMFAKSIFYISQSINPELSMDITPASLFYILPIQASAMIVCLFLGFDIAVCFSIILSILTSIIFDNNFEVFFFFFLSSLTAAYLTKIKQERKTIIFNGFKLAVFNVALTFALGLYSFDKAKISFVATEMMLAFSGGILSATFTLGFIPLIEILFDYTTDSKLLEFAKLDQPLIKKLMIRSPGTYNHSIFVATLAEAAASSIEANSLKAKVMAYYHDIGKMEKALYFIENQLTGQNKHDKLSASMSALILIEHVKKGVKIAKENKLCKEIIEGIVQHHGTSLIKYFHAKSMKTDKENTKEENFRYPGPKPQTVEAGIVMLADVIEAAVRALERPTASRIKGRVKELINDIFADGQLDECELTLKDLNEIAKSFNKILTSIYHTRIEYTDKSNEQKKEKNESYKSADKKSVQRKNTNHYSPPKDKTNLKRLGL